ncbi:IPTL-CTERM sorting domain-containing protein [Acidovorax sp. ACV01]|uniref:IPTL-CTERM sorting domain-containing protein n=1 Tax=Acidovorax sp. ACV01 TaxID=2769311 RepID=UPI00177AC145|nr:IPTL-CTERM sorting domain-containing protein [Acidovorax sp. ACV01]
MLFSGSDTNISSANPISLLWSSALAASSVPTLSEWALMAIAALLAMWAAGQLHRRV